MAEKGRKSGKEFWRVVLGLRWVGERVFVGANEEGMEMESWIFFVVGVVAGMNLGYMFGVHRGAAIVGELIGGFMDALGAMTNGKSD